MIVLGPGVPSPCPKPTDAPQRAAAAAALSGPSLARWRQEAGAGEEETLLADWPALPALV